MSREPSHFTMIDVGRKRPTRRYAVATGTITMNSDAFAAVKNGTLPKGNVLALAEAAGIMAAKKTPDMLPMCHTIPLDQVRVHFTLNDNENSITAYAEATAHAKTGVEMEVLQAVQTALLTIWDLTKGIDPALSMGQTRLLVKTGGKSGVWTHPEGIPDWLQSQLPSPQTLSGYKTGVIVMSDRAAKGTYNDESGTVLKDILENTGAQLTGYEVIPDDAGLITQTITSHCADHKPDLLMVSGGTGPGPRDVTPDVLIQICDRMLDGLGELLRHESLYYTDTAWLSRMTAGILNGTLIIAFPGSPKAVKECWDIIAPFIGDALGKIKKQGYEDKK